MLGKMMKYEFKATSRRIIPVVIVMAAMALINRIMVPVFLSSTSRGVHSLHMLFDGILTAAFITLAVVAFIVMINRFYRNILGDEGYTTMTLPVTENQLLWSKLLTALIWAIAIGLIMLLVLFVRAGHISALTEFFDDLINYNLNSISDGFSVAHLIGYALEIALFCCIMFIDMCLTVYASLTYGHMFRKHKIFMAAVIFAVITALLIVLVFNLALFLDSAICNEQGLWGNAESTTQAHILAWLGIFLVAIPGAIMYIATYLGLKKNLNLE